jgi:carbonic anhydrase
MRKLLKGVHQFQTNYFSTHREMFEKLSLGQHPRILFITCSDSRIDPNLITQTEPGELFIIRNVGNIIPPYGATTGAEGAAIEYAVEALGGSSPAQQGNFRLKPLPDGTFQDSGKSIT